MLPQIALIGTNRYVKLNMLPRLFLHKHVSYTKKNRWITHIPTGENNEQQNKSIRHNRYLRIHGRCNRTTYCHNHYPMANHSPTSSWRRYQLRHFRLSRCMPNSRAGKRVGIHDQQKRPLLRNNILYLSSSSHKK